MKADDAGTWIRLHDQMPDHPKIGGLSDKGFRLLVTTWCWCSQHLTDGHVPAKIWAKRGTPAARKELAEAGLVEDAPDGGVWMHDYLHWQRSKAEAADGTEKKRAAGQRGAHARWHGPAGGFDPACPMCQRGANVTDLRPRSG